MDAIELEEQEEVPDEFLRFGIQFPDGRKVTNLDQPYWDLSPDATQAEYGMESNSGSGSDTHYTAEWWAWPVPESSGQLAFVCEWPAYEIPQTRVEIDAELVRDAARRAQPVWSDLAQGATHMTRAAMFRPFQHGPEHQGGGPEAPP